MSRPAPGNYIIYSRILSSSGRKLAMTFKGENQFATVEDFADQENKQIVRDFSPLLVLYLLCLY